MNDYKDRIAFELIYVIVDCGMSKKVLSKAKKQGVKGSTVFIGKGTVNNSFLNFLSLYEEKKEIILMGADKKTADKVLVELNDAFHFKKPNHGIIFTTCTTNIVGSKQYHEDDLKEGSVKKPMYQLIITIVNKGKANDVVTAANDVGSKGGTILNARGSGVHETSRLFNMEIEPEKEMVMILSKTDMTEYIVDSIREKLELDQPGNGIIFTQDVNNAYGIFE